MYRQLISNSWKACLLFVCVFFSGITVKADDSLYSPNKKIGVSWDNPAKGLRVIYKKRRCSDFGSSVREYRTSASTCIRR